MSRHQSHEPSLLSKTLIIIKEAAVPNGLTVLNRLENQLVAFIPKEVN